MEHTISILHDCRTVEVKLYNVEIGNTSCDITYHIYNENDFKKFFDNIIVDDKIEQYIKNYLFGTDYSGYSEDCEKKVLQRFNEITKDILTYPTLKKFVVEYKHKCKIDNKDVIVTNVENTPIEITKVKDESIFRFDYNKPSDEDAGYIFVHIDDAEEKKYGLHKYNARILVNKNEENNIDSITCFLSKIHSAYNDYYKEKYGYQVTGSVPKTPLISAVMSKQNFNNHCKVIPTAIKDKFSKQTVNNMITTNGLSLIPIGAKRHATLLIVEKTNDNASYLYSLIDTSLQHVMLDKKQVITDIFDGFNNNEISVLLTSPLQINGCCSYWVDSFMEAIVMNPEKYTSMESIKNAINDGSLIYEACCIMSQIFDEQGRETVKKISENETNNDGYIVFNIGSEKYGINKNCYNNRFVNICNLINCLSTEEQKTIGEEPMNELKVQIDKQEKLRSLVLFVNKTEKLMKQETDILDFYDKLVSMSENECDKIIEKICNKTEREKIHTQLKHCLENHINIKSLQEKQIEHLELVKNTICKLLNRDNEMFVENFEQKCGECTKVEGFITLFNLNIIKESYSKQQTINTQKPSSCELDVEETVLMYDNIVESKNEVVLTLPTTIPQPSPSPETKEKASEIKQQLDDGKSRQQDLHSGVGGSIV